MSDQPVLQQGSDDAQRVSYLQQCLSWQLQARGSSTTVQETASFDDATAAAVREFQELAGLTADGIVGDSTWAALLAAPEGGGAAAEGTGDACVDFGSEELTYVAGIDDWPDALRIMGTNLGGVAIPAGAVIVAEANGQRCELQLSSELGPGAKAAFLANVPEGVKSDSTYTVTAPAELGGATKSGTMQYESF